MLVDYEHFIELLRCPRTGARLEQDEGWLKSLDGYSRYEIINRIPVVVDFERSILKAENVAELTPVIDRRNYDGVARWLQRLAAPAKGISSDNIKRVITSMSEYRADPVVLIVGGGTRGHGVSLLYDDPIIKLLSFDIYATPNVQFIADANSIPLASESVDGVVIQNVLEHVLDPQEVVGEIHRVLKHDGIVYAETPFIQHVHEGAYDFSRFTESGHRYLFRHFSIVDSGAIAGAGTQLLWSIDNFFRGLFRSRTIGRAIKLCFFWLKYFDHLIPSEYNIDSASDVFFLGHKASTPIEPAAMVSYYKGAQR